MPAYWLARAKIFDPVQYKRYTDLVPDILARHGGRVLSRGAAFETLEGPQDFQRFVLIEFDSMAAARGCFESPEYVAAAAHRRAGGGQIELTIIAAGDGTLR